MFYSFLLSKEKNAFNVEFREEGFPSKHDYLWSVVSVIKLYCCKPIVTAKGFIFIKTSELHNICRKGSTRRNFPRAAQFFFVFFRLVLPENSHTKKNCAARGIFRLVENSLR